MANLRFKGSQGKRVGRNICTPHVDLNMLDSRKDLCEIELLMEHTRIPMSKTVDLSMNSRDLLTLIRFEYLCDALEVFEMHADQNAQAKGYQRSFGVYLATASEEGHSDA